MPLKDGKDWRIRELENKIRKLRSEKIAMMTALRQVFVFSAGDLPDTDILKGSET